MIQPQGPKEVMATLINKHQLKTLPKADGEIICFVKPNGAVALKKEGIETTAGLLGEFPDYDFGALRWKRLPMAELEKIYGSPDAVRATLAGTTLLTLKSQSHAAAVESSSAHETVVGVVR